jgi:hypothetical protein
MSRCRCSTGSPRSWTATAAFLRVARESGVLELSPWEPRPGQMWMEDPDDMPVVDLGTFEGVRRGHGRGIASDAKARSPRACSRLPCSLVSERCPDAPVDVLLGVRQRLAIPRGSAIGWRGAAAARPRRRLRGAGVPVGWRLEKADQLPDGVMAMLRVAERKLAVNLVPVVSPHTRLGQVAGLLKVLDDLRRRALGHPDGGGDITKTRGGVRGDALEHMCVVGHEAPGMISISGT